jgi:enamine deaminase RidA (YjgF/YER057c/UK114 family)
MMGCVGRNADLAVAQAAARQTGLALLATLRGHLGSLDRVERLVRLFGMVNCVAEFQQHPAVINGCSELLAAVFGSDRGVGARSAIGVVSLPAGMLVEIEAVFQLRED